MITANEIYLNAVAEEANANLNADFYSAIAMFAIAFPALGLVYALVYFLFSLNVQ